jgi:hypothetical protein
VEHNEPGQVKSDFPARHARHAACHTSHVTRHTSHVTRHTSHVTRHTSHVTRHTLGSSRRQFLGNSAEQTSVARRKRKEVSVTSCT